MKLSPDYHYYYNMAGSTYRFYVGNQYHEVAIPGDLQHRITQVAGERKALHQRRPAHRAYHLDGVMYIEEILRPPVMKFGRRGALKPDTMSRFVEDMEKATREIKKLDDIIGGHYTNRWELRHGRKATTNEIADYSILAKDVRVFNEKEKTLTGDIKRWQQHEVDRIKRELGDNDPQVQKAKETLEARGYKVTK